MPFSQQGGNLAPFYLIAGLPQQLQQLLKTLRFLFKGIVNGIADTLPVGGFLLIAQPLVVGLALALGIFNNGVTVLNTDRIIEAAYSLGAAPKVTEFALLIEGGGVPNHMIVNVGFVDVRTDDVGMIAFCESPSQLTA